ncbi:Protein xmas-2, partial [Eufriesea mexicana]
MEYKGDTQTDIFSSEQMASKTFIFSKPRIFSSAESINSEINFEQLLDTSVIRKNLFTFAMPMSVTQSNDQDVSVFQMDTCEKQYKPKISRNSYKPAVNVFAQALKDTAMFEQLKKNSRSQATKVNPENSITCTNVPQSLLTKVTAKEYFIQFGNLLKITIRSKKQIITVIYATKEEANIAYNKSGEYLGEKFNVEWTKSCVSPKSPTKKKDLQKNIIPQIVSNFFKSPDDEIKSELEAMTNLEYNLHNRNNIDGSLIKRHKTLQSKNISKSITRLEKASAKAEKHKSDSQISDLLPNATIEELQNIIQQPAYTSEDKYKVLEARDRLMRMRQVRSHTLAAAKVMTGTCPDMCPEKERLMREAKRQVALYEQLETNEYRINHMIAVKQYSRSSADQEEPMAHELRPVKSLKMTMSYLLHEIVNLCDQQGTNLGEWYHFLWDRTRGVRKDITQQELCCIDSVELVEQCARFHIVCSERLCAEEPSVFDKKINSDNLTKCLQSLKYMYHDLRVKKINCENEPEFQAYIILLNLNNGNFMWDLQRLPKNIQKSSEVRFALEIYSALESNNYYKFFKLVQKTTHLNACILLRYFNQVRLKALSVLVKAYCRTASTAYPLYELIDILGFESENEAIYFCEQVGLNVSKDGLHVLLNRHNFTMPVLNIKQNRACNLNTTIKSNVNISCVSKPQVQINKFQTNINSGLMKSKTENEKDPKTFSFIQQQQLNESSILSNIFNTTPTTSKTSNTFPKKFELPPNSDISPFVTATNKNIFSEMSQGNTFMKNLTPSTVFSSTYSNKQTVPKSPNIINSATIMNKNISKETQDIFAHTKEMKRSASQEEMTEKLKSEEHESVKKSQQIDDMAKRILNSLQTEVIQAHCSAVVKEEVDKLYMYNTLSEDINNEILNEVTYEICNNLLKEEIVNARKLCEISIKIKNRVIIKYFNIWKFNTVKKKQQRKVLENTPVWLQKHSSKQCAKLLYSKQQNLVIKSMCKKRNEPKNVECYSESLAPIKVIIYIGIKEYLKSLDINIHSNYYWKLVISWPNLHNKAVLWQYKKIINQYLCPEDYTTDPIMKLYQPNETETLHICIRHFEGLISDHNLIGSDALLFIADATEEIKFIIKRLTKTVLSRDRLMPIPLVFIILGDSNFQIQNKEVVSNLEKLLQSGYLSVYTIMHEKNLTEKTILNLTQSAILWLSINKSPQNPLQMDYLQNIYNTCLTEDLWLRIYDNSFSNEKLIHALEEPKFIIDLHNEAVSYLIDIILNPESFMYTKFAPEFQKFIKKQCMMPCNYEHFDDTWKNEDYKAKLEKVMSSFKLPQWKYPWPINNSVIFRQHITNYCQEALFTSDSDEICCNILKTRKEKKKRNAINEPVVKKRKLNEFQENNFELEPLATFCENSRSQVMEVHYISN